MSKELEIEIDKEVFLPAYWHLINTTADINLLWGGRDSGKSRFIGQRLILDCMGFNDCMYFRCVLIKKTFESIKDAQWQTIKDICDDWNLDAFFTFKIKPLEIHCMNGNKFIARGCDEPGKLKSISNPSHAWFEEGNQLTEGDYITAASTLRSNDGKVKQWFSFNPEAKGDYEEFWIYKMFFKKHQNIYGRNFESKITMELKKESGEIENVSLNYTSTHTTYRDNKYVRSERKAFLEMLRDTNTYYYSTFTDGKWGNKQNDSPFAFAFDRKKHLGRPEPNRGQYLYLSFDFNRNPICCTSIQHYEGKIRFLRTIKLPNSDIYKLCTQIKSYYIGFTYIVTGDASGQSSSAMVQDKLNYYIIIKQQLGLSSAQIKVPTVNPKIEDNQFLVNAILANYPIEFHEIDCKPLIFDMENVKMLAKGTIDKTDRDDPTQQADALDTMRYYLNTFHWDFYKRK